METQNTKPHDEGYPIWIYKGGDKESTDKLLCGSKAIADDWATRGYYPTDSTDKPDAEFVGSQVAKDAPAEVGKPDPEVPQAPSFVDKDGKFDPANPQWKDGGQGSKHVTKPKK